MPEAKTFGGGLPTFKVCNIDVQDHGVTVGQNANVVLLEYNLYTAPAVLVTIPITTSYVENILFPWAVLDDGTGVYAVLLNQTSAQDINEEELTVGPNVKLSCGVKRNSLVPAGNWVITLQLIQGVNVKVYGAWLKVLALFCEVPT
jgi:hypothetical protein